MEHGLLLLTLDHEWYGRNKGRLLPEFFPGGLLPLFDTIKEAHDTYERTLTLDEVVALYRANNPSMTTAARRDFEELLFDLKREQPLGPDVAEDVLGRLWLQEVGRQIAEDALVMATEGTNTLSAIQRRLEELGENVGSDHVEYGPMDLDDILAMDTERVGWSFNIRPLQRMVGPLAGGDFVVIAARPDVGKSALPISLAMAPGGWCHQGAKVHILANEEKHERHKLRAVNAVSQMTKEEVKADPEMARAAWNEVVDNFRVFDGMGWTIDRIDAYCKKVKPDILVLDMLDKVEVNGSFTRTDEMLGEVYRQSREIAKRHDCVVIGLSQLSAEAEGKSQCHHSQLAGSKTSKAAEADAIICIGKHPPQDNAEPDPHRFLNITKNKLSGKYGTVITLLDPDRTTYSA